MPDDAWEDVAAQLGAERCGACEAWTLTEELRQVRMDDADKVRVCPSCYEDICS